MLTILCVLAGLGFFFFLSISMRHHRAANQPFERLQNQIRRIDVAAFQNLSSSADQQFLRRRLSPYDFRRLQHVRTRAMMSYLLAVGHNAAVLIKMGEIAMQSPDKQVAETGRQLVDTALQTRLLVLRIYPRLIAMWLLPVIASADFGPIISRYDLLLNELIQLIRLQQPKKPVPHLAALS